MIDRRHFLKSAAAAAAAAPCLAADTAAAKPRGKKGCCFVVDDNGNWLKRLQLLRGHWLYGWGWKKPADFPRDAEFCPMLWGDSQAKKRAAALAQLKTQAEQGEIRSLMGFNEPDQHDQSNMTVERVVELWPELETVEVPLVSPGCVHPDREWMRAFMPQVEKQGLRVDFVAVHSYGGPSAEALVKRLERVHQEFGRPLWITEFAVGDWDAKSAQENRHSPERVAGFMTEILPALDELDFVDRYSWFSASVQSAALGTSALLTPAGTLTPLGEIYAAHDPGTGG